MSISRSAAFEVKAARDEVLKLEAEANWIKRLDEILEHTRTGKLILSSRPSNASIRNVDTSSSLLLLFRNPAGDFASAAQVLKEVRGVLGVTPSDPSVGSPSVVGALKESLPSLNVTPGGVVEAYPELAAAEKELTKVPSQGPAQPPDAASTARMEFSSYHT
jgi:hypothetical protein